MEYISEKIAFEDRAGGKRVDMLSYDLLVVAPN